MAARQDRSRWARLDALTLEVLGPPDRGLALPGMRHGEVIAREVETIRAVGLGVDSWDRERVILAARKADALMPLRPGHPGRASHPDDALCADVRRLEERLGLPPDADWWAAVSAVRGAAATSHVETADDVP